MILFPAAIVDTPAALVGVSSNKVQLTGIPRHQRIVVLEPGPRPQQIGAEPLGIELQVRHGRRSVVSAEVGRMERMERIRRIVGAAGGCS